MLILSNCLSEKIDEGCLKVANSLVKRITKAKPETLVITYDRQPEFDTLQLKLNKFLINRKLISEIKKRKEKVLYIPFPAKDWATALRIFILSRFSKKQITALLTMQCNWGVLGRLLVKWSKARLLTLSENTRDIYSKIIGEDRAIYLKTGVDTEKFTPVSSDQKKSLKVKYGLDAEKPVILHVGHLKRGRNVAELMKLDSKYSIVLVASTQFENEQDKVLRDELLQRANIKIIDKYLENIEEVYQMAEVYFFPVIAEKNCIDVPLSCLEAAACNLPVVTTDYGEMSAFKGKNGFLFIKSFDADELNQKIEDALKLNSICTREQVLEYDWQNAISFFESME